MKFIRLILATSLGLFLPLLAMAQVGSNQPVSIIVPYMVQAVWSMRSIGLWQNGWPRCSGNLS